MAMGSLLCVLDGTAGSEATLRTALTIGRRMNAHVEVLHVALDPENAVPLAADGMTATMVDEIVQSVEREGRQRLQAAETLFARLVEEFEVPRLQPGEAAWPGFSASWLLLRGREHDVVAERGMVNDLIIMLRGERDGEFVTTPTLEAALMESGRPLLVIPQGASVTDVGKRAVIGWRQSVPGVHAIAAALPFLHEARAVEVVTVRDRATVSQPDEVVRYLAFHGIASRGHAIDAAGREAGRALLDTAEKAEADLLVLGAYAHSRLRQLILGGVTSTVLRSARMPVLLAH